MIEATKHMACNAALRDHEARIAALEASVLVRLQLAGELEQTKRGADDDREDLAMAREAQRDLCEARVRDVIRLEGERDAALATVGSLRAQYEGSHVDNVRMATELASLRAQYESSHVDDAGLDGEATPRTVRCAWVVVPRSAGPTRRTRSGNLRIELMPEYPENDREWRVTFYLMRLGKKPRDLICIRANGSEGQVRARAEMLSIAMIQLQGEKT